MKPGRVKVKIYCNRCGERFILRGIQESNGRVQTGFRRCLCDNEADFEVQTEKM